MPRIDACEVDLLSVLLSLLFVDFLDLNHYSLPEMLVSIRINGDFILLYIVLRIHRVYPGIRVWLSTLIPADH